MLSTLDAARWRQVLPADVSVMGCLEHVRILERQTGCAARLFVVEAPEPVLAYPYFLRPIAELPFASAIRAPAWDVYSPTYTGPLALGSWREASSFASLFERYCREQHIVAEFAHLNPWDVAEGSLDASRVVLDREIVYVDLTRSEEEIWTKSLTTDCRRQTKKAREAGVRIRRATSLDDVNAFHRLHKDTMDRRQALDRYYHPAEYFHELFTALPENVFYVLAEYEGRVVSGGLFLQDRDTVYWELSAVDMKYSQARAVNGYLHDTILAAHREGRKRMVLGAGYEPGDGVYRFKASFSPLRAKFSTYKRIHDAAAYETLTRAWSAHHGGVEARGDYFPAYRANGPVPAEQNPPAEPRHA